jgi:hypothetical protein
MTTEELQSEIKNTMSSLGWKTTHLAEVLYVAINDDDVQNDDPEEIKRFYEKLKGQLKRETTNPELLANYLKILSEHPEVQKHKLILPIYPKNNCLSDKFVAKMSQLSKEITKQAEGIGDS